MIELAVDYCYFDGRCVPASYHFERDGMRVDSADAKREGFAVRPADVDVLITMIVACVGALRRDGFAPSNVECLETWRGAGPSGEPGSG